jgi:HEAT repeat protein
LTQLLQHSLPGVRASAAEAVEFIGGEAGTMRILQQLTALKTDADRDVRFRAEEALYRLTGKR